MTHTDPPGPFSFGGAVGRGDPRVPPGSVAFPQLPATRWFGSCLCGLDSHGGLSLGSSAETHRLKAALRWAEPLARESSREDRTGRPWAPARGCAHTRGAGERSSAHYHTQRAWAALEPVTQQRKSLSNGEVIQGVQESKWMRHKASVKQNPGLPRPRGCEKSLWGWQTPAQRSHQTLFQCKQSCHST